MKGYWNFVILGALFAICFAGAIHGSHDNDKELLAFSVDSAKQILAAILTITAVTTNRRAADFPNGGTNGTTKTNGGTPAASVVGSGH